MQKPERAQTEAYERHACRNSRFGRKSKLKKWLGAKFTPRPHCTPGKDPVTIVQEAGWAPGPVWTGAENLAPTGIRSPNRMALMYLLVLSVVYFHITLYCNIYFVAWDATSNEAGMI
jgi:hypothetical protein